MEDRAKAGQHPRRSHLCRVRFRLSSGNGEEHSVIFVKHQWDADNNEFVMDPDHDFISHVKGMFASTDTLLFMCRSGGVAPGLDQNAPLPFCMAEKFVR